MRRNSISTPVIIIAAVALVCGFCGLFGLVSKNRNEIGKPAGSYVVSTPIIANSPAATNSSGNLLPAGSLVETANSANAQKIKDRQSATIINENVSLRKTANSNGEVLGTLLKGAEIEVIRRKKAWVYVAGSGQTGWLHGNAMRLADGFQSESAATLERNPPPTYSPKNNPKTPAMPMTAMKPVSRHAISPDRAADVTISTETIIKHMLNGICAAPEQRTRVTKTLHRPRL